MTCQWVFSLQLVEFFETGKALSPLGIEYMGWQYLAKPAQSPANDATNVGAGVGMWDYSRNSRLPPFLAHYCLSRPDYQF